MDIRELLLAVSERWPLAPIDGAKFQPRHNITLPAQISDGLELSILWSGRWHSFIVDNDDLDNPGLLDEIDTYLSDFGQG